LRIRKEYESRTKTFLRHLTKAEIPDLAWIQSELQFRLGGLGLKYSISHHQAAFPASLIQCNFWIEKVCSPKARNLKNTNIYFETHFLLIFQMMLPSNQQCLNNLPFNILSPPALTLTL
jgi:hypothetical protein